MALEDRQELESYFSRDRALHMYELGDLVPLIRSERRKTVSILRNWD